MVNGGAGYRPVSASARAGRVREGGDGVGGGVDGGLNVGLGNYAGMRIGLGTIGAGNSPLIALFTISPKKLVSKK